MSDQNEDSKTSKIAVESHLFRNRPPMTDLTPTSYTLSRKDSKPRGWNQTDPAEDQIAKPT